MNKNKGGRPTKMTPDTVAKLEMGFLKGLNDTECCHYADISRDVLYDYQKKHPEFVDRKNELKSNTSVKAKLNVAEAIENGDVDLSKWYLERKNRDEFSLKQTLEAEVKDSVTIKVELID